MRQQLSLTPRIFISHSSKDATFALKLVQDLRKVLGDESLVWLDLGELKGGNKWWRMIVEELSSRNIFIVILSPDAVRSKWVDDEIDLAWSRKNATGVGMQIIPVLYRDCQVRDDLKILQMVSFKAPKPYDVAFDELLTAISPPMRVAHIPGTAQRLLNRRAFLISGGAVVLAAAGGAALLVYELHDHHSIGSTPTPSPNPTQTAIAQAKNDYEKNFAANGIMYGFNAQHTRTNPYEIILNTDNVSSLKLYWKASTKGTVSSSPTVANGVVYVASDDGHLYAFNANTGGTPLWTFPVGAFYSCPAVANGVIYIGSEFNNALYAFHLP